MGGLFEIECNHHHIVFCLAYAVSECLHRRVVLQVGTVALNQVAEAEAEFHFRAELEVGQIYIATEAYGEHGVGGIELQLLAATFAHVEHAHHTAYHVGAHIVVP